jgi:hypothetical protein
MNLYQNVFYAYRKVRNLEIIRQRRFSGGIERQPGRPGMLSEAKIGFLDKRKPIGGKNKLTG